MYLGFVAQGSDIQVPTLVKNSSGVPKNADALPTLRVYGPSGLMAGGTGSLALKDHGTVTGASNASPVAVTSSGHGLTTGARVTISGVGGTVGANGEFFVTVVDANTFTLDGSTGGGAYTSGGVWNVTGLYEATLTASAVNGYVSGQTYSVLVSAAVASAAVAELHTFTVV